MTEKTPGQVAFENCGPRRPYFECTWDHAINIGAAVHWEAAAEAVRKPLIARIAELENALATLRDNCDWDTESEPMKLVSGVFQTK